MDALPFPPTKMAGMMLHSSIRSSKVIPLLTSPVCASNSQPSSSMGLTPSRTTSLSNGQRFINKVRRNRSLKCVGIYAYGGRSQESVIEEEMARISETVPVKLSPGQPFPLGASELENGINFAIFSQHASSIILCLSIPERGEIQNLDSPMVEIKLDPEINKTEDIWHVCVEDLPRSGVLYGYRINGPQGWELGHRFDSSVILLDPYAKLVDGRRVFGDASHKMSKVLGTYDFSALPFDWGDDYKFPNIPEKDLVIYEMNVHGFTADESSGLDPNVRGSYLGVIEKIPHLLELGINAVELLPTFEFDEFEFQRRPNPRDHMINTWGYSTVNFFAPMTRYASSGGGPVAAAREFKQMVKALHNAGIEVILDVVYNHTNEGDDLHPYTTSFRGIDNKVYYMLNLNNNPPLLNFSGCDCGLLKQKGSSHVEQHVGKPSNKKDPYGTFCMNLSHLTWRLFALESSVD